jgi:hypothetical protein
MDAKRAKLGGGVLRGLLTLATAAAGERATEVVQKLKDVLLATGSEDPLVVGATGQSSRDFSYPIGHEIETGDSRHPAAQTSGP